MPTVPTIQLNDGNAIPQLGLGVWQVPPEQTAPTVLAAIAAGYTLIDTAQGYHNEEGVGAGIRAAGVDRSRLFVTSKLRTRDQRFDDALRSFEGSLGRLGLDYLDMFLIHWPVPGQDLYVEAWRALVRLQEEGRVRSIGVSNFLPEHIERIVAASGVRPAVNQIELHPEFQQRDVRGFHARHGIAIECYSPLGSGAVLDNSVLAEIAARHERSPAQVALRWHLQQGLIVIPKTIHAERLRQNIDVFDFELGAADMQRLAGLDRPDGRQNSNPASYNDIW
ncbi:aldo/keto reductase [Devosia sp.]|uniref:aldo/keto reductase n=1 Tax=Devosia sp. TaxID=1871048 RepID=UPI002EF3C01C